MASDAAAIVEHTKQVIFLEDDDVVFVEDGTLSIHRISKHPTDGQANDVQKREVISLNMELQEIMKVGDEEIENRVRRNEMSFRLRQF